MISSGSPLRGRQKILNGLTIPDKIFGIAFRPKKNYRKNPAYFYSASKLGGVFKLPTSVVNVFALSQEWSEFYSKDYIKVGVLEGLYYTKEGKVTEEWKKLQVWPYLRWYPPFFIISLLTLKIVSSAVKILFCP
jgi:hypothetical protein